MIGEASVVFGTSPAGLSSDALGHVQWCQHLFKDGALHVGTPQVGFLKVTPRQVTVLQDTNGIHGTNRLKGISVSS